jgi:putative Holliday junction resolvase
VIALVLAFDFGTRRIGIASGDTLTCTARPLTTLEYAGATPWAAIDRVLGDYSAQQLVVGVPYNLDGSETHLTRPSLEFAAALGERAVLPVALVDETSSSREAEAELKAARAQGLKRRRVTHSDVDRIAAKVILQRWFEQGMPTDRPLQPGK